MDKMLFDNVKTIYVDVDGVILNTAKAIVDIYNEDFSCYRNYKYVNWWDIDSWGFDEEYSWNRNWKGIRTINWQEVKQLLLP